MDLPHNIQCGEVDNNCCVISHANRTIMTESTTYSSYRDPYKPIVQIWSNSLSPLVRLVGFWRRTKIPRCCFLGPPIGFVGSLKCMIFFIILLAEKYSFIFGNQDINRGETQCLFSFLHWLI